MVFTDTSIYKTVKMKNFPKALLTFYSYYTQIVNNFSSFSHLLNIGLLFKGCFSEIFNLNTPKVHKKLIFL
ncbi:hypothetical protein EGY07_12245 [Chryseobacterium indologenes]|uniref:Uncharacterized protein n=1 Tax=Chryseobacterium indologenes TaxID=253 RepID=A0AAD1DT62_CHRID|nr:hypothetical protein CEQ15_04275 [Chryseobacterium indologenes]ATN04855.1 hypothetical protein CRN76_05290 [Chryseobacterium indologenes]AYY86393.1 hypothetical protein EGX91_18465 [Chryseobacterium indologenes]AYZ36295.1 hypothetical protein EGY07_12245 [Chryseobacterium indologenes]AZB16465.1 hypothetical protein EG352_01060 [Chryseobacterium indologenes]